VSIPARRTVWDSSHEIGTQNISAIRPEPRIRRRAGMGASAALDQDFAALGRRVCRHLHAQNRENRTELLDLGIQNRTNVDQLESYTESIEMKRWTIRNYNTFLREIRSAHKLTLGQGREAYRQMRAHTGRNLYGADVRKHPNLSARFAKSARKKRIIAAIDEVFYEDDILVETEADPYVV
jgi:hypothetical protein